VGITDVALERELPLELSDVSAAVACIGMALPSEGYRELFGDHGFTDIEVTDHTRTLADLVKEIQTKVMMARLAASSGIFQVDGIDLRRAQDLLFATNQAVKEGDLAYIMLTARA